MARGSLWDDRTELRGSRRGNDSLAGRRWIGICEPVQQRYDALLLCSPVEWAIDIEHYLVHQCLRDSRGEGIGRRCDADRTVRGDRSCIRVATTLIGEG